MLRCPGYAAVQEYNGASPPMIWPQRDASERCIHISFEKSRHALQSKMQVRTEQSQTHPRANQHLVEVKMQLDCLKKIIEVIMADLLM